MMCIIKYFQIHEDIILKQIGKGITNRVNELNLSAPVHSFTNHSFLSSPK